MTDRENPDKPWGVCNVCKEVVTHGEAFTHPCPNFYVSYAWYSFANPHNTPWIPGYRFTVRQASQKVTRGNYHMRPREYAVVFEIDPEGLLRWVGGVKVTPRTLKLVEEAYARGRPGSNYFPGCTDDYD